jgi:hypothetical protein
MTGDVYDIIAEFLPLKNENVPPPYFTMLNKKSLQTYLTYKKENFSIQNEIL